MERPVRSKQRRKLPGGKAASPAPKAAKRKIKVDNVISVGQLAHELGVKAPVVIRQLMGLGIPMATVNQMLDMDTAALVAAEFEYEVENVGFQEENYLEAAPEATEAENLVPRPPVVTIMGHVDHGKTTLLDAIRKSRVAQGEAGGITQHIGAYQVETDRGVITFIDTPGHAAFTAMRARGATVTDIVVLVVAADDGVQPQTVEAIQHARVAKVPIVVAVNKMDKAGVTMDPIMTRLSEQELVPEQWGGDTMYAPVSALKGEGIDGLLESILLQAEVLALKANPDRFAEGVVLEAKMERGRGAVATVLVQHGTLKRGDHVVLGSAYGRVRAIVDSRGNNMKEATPSTPVELFGLSELPEVGDSVHAVKSEQNARALAEHRANTKRETAMMGQRRKTVDDVFASANAEDNEEFRVILKADVGGSLQALKGAIEQIQVDGATCRILLSGVGDVTESDVNAAAAYDAHILGFNVRLDAKARQAASANGVEPEFYTVIYDVLDRVTRGLKGLLAPVYEQVRVGTVEVRQLFKISKVGTVAGSYVLDGKVARGNTVKVLREGKTVHEGKVSSLRRFKDDVREVTAGHECGVSLDGFEELQPGDLVECYAEQIVASA
jgi:translation initiation factor IF-2